jgi:hypothetical protein
MFWSRVLASEVSIEIQPFNQRALVGLTPTRFARVSVNALEIKPPLRCNVEATGRTPDAFFATG